MCYKAPTHSLHKNRCLTLHCRARGDIWGWREQGGVTLGMFQYHSMRIRQLGSEDPITSVLLCTFSVYTVVLWIPQGGQDCCATVS